MIHRTSLDTFGRYLGAQSLPAPERSRAPKPAITISRETGSGALSVASLIAEKLNVDCQGDPPCPWTVFDRNLVAKILEDHKLSAATEAFMPEDTRFSLTDAFESLLGLHPGSWNLREYAKRTVQKLASGGNVILVGRGSAIVTANLSNVLHVRLVAPLDFRVRHYAEFRSISAAKATQEIREMDEARRRYLHSYFNADADDPLHYHLTLNTGRTGFQQTAQIICSAVNGLLTHHHPPAHSLHSG